MPPPLCPGALSSAPATGDWGRGWGSPCKSPQHGRALCDFISPSAVLWPRVPAGSEATGSGRSEGWASRPQAYCGEQRSLRMSPHPAPRRPRGPLLTSGQWLAHQGGGQSTGPHRVRFFCEGQRHREHRALTLGGQPGGTAWEKKASAPLPSPSPPWSLDGQPRSLPPPCPVRPLPSAVQHWQLTRAPALAPEGGWPTHSAHRPLNSADHTTVPARALLGCSRSLGWLEGWGGPSRAGGPSSGSWLQLLPGSSLGQQASSRPSRLGDKVSGP